MINAADWAAPYMARPGIVLPLYDSDEWLVAPEIVKVASCVRAAEAWRQEHDPHVLAARLDLELQAGWRERENDYAAWRVVASRVRALPSQVSHAELLRRRAGS